jgi:nitrogen fixation/metabolism regulation signal transduction histidine kinase
VRGPGRLPFEKRVAFAALAAGAPAIGLAAFFVFRALPSYEAWSAVLVVSLAWVAGAIAVHGWVGGTMRTLANLVEAIRARDFSIRAPENRERGDLGAVLRELSMLSSSLRERRLESAEASALLQTVLAQVSVALFAFDRDERLTLVNAAGLRLLDRSHDDAIGALASELDAAAWLSGDAPRIVEQRGTRLELRRVSFRQRGLPSVLVVLTDVTRALRVEEREAWRRLVRVLSHEVNNSLAPIQSIAESQTRAIARTPRAGDWETDLVMGLDIIARRSSSLARFLAAYAKLARLPPPARRPLDLAAAIERVATLETRVPVSLERGPRTTIAADGDQIEAMLVNVVKNAAEASLPTGGSVRVRWQEQNGDAVITIEDDGDGVADRTHLFVPFFTTKPNGSGIGLALSRQIVDAHEGAITLEPRDGARGSVARIRLPISAPATLASKSPKA